MSTTGPRSQIPLNRAIVDNNGMLTVPWSFWFQSQNAALPPAGAGYVVDGSAATVTMTIFQGPDSQKGTPQPGYIYFATDTGKTYVSVGGNWVLQDPAYVGDVTKPAGSQTLTLANVFASPGTYGSSTLTPIITVDDKGRITNLSFQTVVAPTTPGGTSGEIQWNNAGVMAGTPGITYVPGSQSLFFTNPQSTINNLSPLIAKGDLMARGNVNTTRFPVGLDGQIIVANSAANVGLTWIDHNYIANGNSNVIIPNVDGNIELNVNGNLVAIFYDTGISSIGNVTAPYFIGNVIADSITGNTIDITGNANIGNIFTNEIYANLIDVTGNITANYAILNEVISNTANIIGNAIIGNISTDTITANIILGNTANITGNVIIGGNLSVGNIDTNLITANVANIIGNIDIGGNINYNRTFGEFYSNVDQINPNISNVNVMTFNNTTTANNITVVSNSRLTIAKAGTYNLQFSAQISQTTGGTHNAFIWLRKNGVDQDWSAGETTVAGNGDRIMAAWNYLITAAAGDYFELAWNATNTNVILDAVTATLLIPGVPSVIVTIVPVGA